MFVRFHGITQHMSDAAGQLMLDLGAEKASAPEAAECISRLVVNGSAAMHEANEDFKRTYGKGN